MVYFNCFVFEMGKCFVQNADLFELYVIDWNDERLIGEIESIFLVSLFLLLFEDKKETTHTNTQTHTGGNGTVNKCQWARNRPFQRDSITLNGKMTWFWFNILFPVLLFFFFILRSYLRPHRIRWDIESKKTVCIWTKLIHVIYFSKAWTVRTIDFFIRWSWQWASEKERKNKPKNGDFWSFIYATLRSK